MMRMIIAEYREKGGGKPVTDVMVSGTEVARSDNKGDTLELHDQGLAEMLSAYGILIASPGAEEKILAHMPIGDMLEPAFLKPFVDAYASELKACEIDVAGSYFFGNLAAMALGQQRLVSQYGVAADFSTSNISVYLLRGSGGYPRIVFVLSSPRLEREPAEAAREGWVRRILSRLNGETLRPLAESWAVATGLRPGYLWGCMPTRFNYAIEQQEGETAKDVELLHRIQGDYRILKEMDRHVFGLPRNPFDVKIRWIEHIGESSQQVRMKNVCCLYHKTEGGSYCYTCPKAGESERARKRAEYRANQSGK